jgi:hypothetical protein
MGSALLSTVAAARESVFGGGWKERGRIVVSLMSVRAIKAGATDFPTKPVDAGVLVQAVRAALQMAETRHQSPPRTSTASRLWCAPKSVKSA